MNARATAIIFGGGQQARVIASLLPHTNIRLAVERDPVGDQLLQAEVLAAPCPPEVDCFIGIGNNLARRAVFNRLLDWGVTPSSCIASTAWIAPDARLGRGLFISPGSVIMTGAALADNVMINTCSSVDHDTVVGEDSQITLGVTIGASIAIGKGCYFGIKSAAVSGVRIDDQVMVMAGAVVSADIPSRTKVGGVPAKPRPFNARDEGYVGRF